MDRQQILEILDDLFHQHLSSDIEQINARKILWIIKDLNINNYKGGVFGHHRQWTNGQPKGMIRITLDLDNPRGVAGTPRKPWPHSITFYIEPSFIMDELLQLY